MTNLFNSKKSKMGKLCPFLGSDVAQVIFMNLKNESKIFKCARPRASYIPSP